MEQQQTKSNIVGVVTTEHALPTYNIQQRAERTFVRAVKNSILTSLDDRQAGIFPALFYHERENQKIK